jgi:hypothetical protein
LRRACSAVVTGLLLTAAGLPAALLTGQAPALASPATPSAHADSAQAGSPVSVAITSMTPQVASPGMTVRLIGTVTNASKGAISDLTVQLLVTGSPIADITIMQADVTSQFGLGQSQVPSHPTGPAAILKAGQTSGWSISVPAAELGMTTFGAYPLTVEADSFGVGLASANTFLPYLPPRRGPNASRRPAPQQIAWAWPLIDQPLTGQPGTLCTSSAGRSLAASLAADGRLGGLLSAGSAYTQQDQLTWAIDPALLWDAKELTKCRAVRPAQAATAHGWISRLKAATASQPLFVTPYANVNLALLGDGRSQDVSDAFTNGRSVAAEILHHSVTPGGAGAGPGVQVQPAGIAWPPGGVASSYTVASLFPDQVQTVLLRRSPARPVQNGAGTAFLYPNLSGHYSRVLLYDYGLTALLQSASTSPGSQFAVAQGFLAETAVMAAQNPGQPIVVAPPQSWQVPASLAANVLRETATAPWLKPVTLSALANEATGRYLQLASDGAGPPGFSGRMLRQLKRVNGDIEQLQAMQADPSQDLSLAVYALESAAWQHTPRNEQLARIRSLDHYVNSQRGGVSVAVTSRVTLGGLKGIVPVLISNQLGYPVSVRLVATYSSAAFAGGLKVLQVPRGMITVRAHGDEVTKLHVQATQVGSVTITLQLVNAQEQSLPGKAAVVTVRATQFGMFAMIVLAAALGVFMIGSAARAIRRRPAPPDNFTDGGHADLDDPQGGQERAEPDSVMPEAH